MARGKRSRTHEPQEADADPEESQIASAAKRPVEAADVSDDEKPAAGEEADDQSDSEESQNGEPRPNADLARMLRRKTAVLQSRTLTAFAELVRTRLASATD